MDTGEFDTKKQEPDVASRAATVSDQLLTADRRDAIEQRNTLQTNALLRREDMEGGASALNKVGLTFDVGGSTRYEVLKEIGRLRPGDVIAVPSTTDRGYRATRTSDGTECDIEAEPGYFREVKNYTAPTVGVEQEVTGYKVNLKAGATAVIGQVKKDGTLLVEFTKDMGTDSMGRGDYTIELRTTPIEKTNADALAERHRATAAIVAAIKEVGDYGTVKSQKRDGFQISITNPDHKIFGAGHMTFGNQASLGVPTEELFATAPTPECQMILSNATWLDQSNAKAIKPGTPTASSGSATNVFVMLASVIRFVAGTVRDAHPMATTIDLNMTDPGIKDSWKVLPRTPPWEWLDCLAEAERRDVAAQLEAACSEDVLDKAAYEYIKTKQDLSGHRVPQATINSKHSSVFEFRSVPPELDNHPYVDKDIQVVDTAQIKKSGAPDWMKQNPMRRKLQPDHDQ